MKTRRCNVREQTGTTLVEKRGATSKSCENASQSVEEQMEDESQLPVTCGNKEGSLDLKKFSKWEKCIFSKGRWFKPTEFEKFGGKEKNKKWKYSILCCGVPLQELIESSAAECSPFTGRLQGMKKNSPKSSRATGRARKTKPRKKQFLSRSESGRRENGHCEDNDNNHDEDEINMTVFHGHTLPVTCGSVSGILHRSRFATGFCGKCIRTEDFWLTPEEFIGLSKQDGAWKKDILTHGRPLGKLIMVSVNKDMCETHDVKQNLQNETYQTVGEFVTDIEHIFQHCSSKGKIKTMRSREQKQKGVYDVLNWLEKNRSKCMHRFWGSMFEDHILQLYPTLRLLRNNLMDGSFKFYEKPLDAEALPEKENGGGKQEKVKEEKRERKRKTDDGSGEDSDGPGPSTASKTARKKKVNKKLSFSSPVKKGDAEEIWKSIIYKTQLPVTCGQQEGTLHRDRLTRGEECIFAKGRWFTPYAFEQFGGKKSSRNWKSSIHCRKTPLKKLFEDGHLQCPQMKRSKRACVLNNAEVPFSASSTESSSGESESSVGTEEERDAADFEEPGGADGGTEFRGRVEEEEEEEEEDMDNLSVFQAPSLPVTCVSLTGTLQKNRFASGLRGKCIRTDESWLTPEEFVKQEETLTDANWRRDIRCHGKTLSFLLKMAQRNDDDCYECYTGGSLVCCDECPRVFHRACHLPAETGDSPEQWMCTFCVLRTSQQWCEPRHMTQQEALNLPVSSQNKLYCHYLLLYTYREDVHRVFVKDPCRTVYGYSEFIAQPMWLDRIKLKLEGNEYKTVEEFVSDFQLIFSNCKTFNEDNEFGKIGARLKDLFDREFQKIFTIQ
ncbi:Nuclear body protein SP140-like protein [Triplophysa tibetana]|uniref:Nuclear body protein SP140-like protein n=1 Tax=Triplophysa tibetana TaxID=1572043 RepID=A0A5A9N7L7_9TELE|nr:Nuclear body protein SP140-like protein [Triplophysa tibetana]